MKSEEIKRAIDELGPWYQRYEMDGHWTTDLQRTGEHVWPDIRSLMNDDLKGARILDIGANAAYYSTMLALDGASVLAVEPSSRYYKQAKWTKHYFEDKHNKELDIKMIKSTVSDLNISKMGRFDYILAISVLYFVGNHLGGKYSPGALQEQKRVVREICQACDKVIVRTRNKVKYSSVSYYSSIFLENEFHMLKKIKAKRPTILYGRLFKDGDYGGQEQSSKH